MQPNEHHSPLVIETPNQRIPPPRFSDATPPARTQTPEASRLALSAERGPNEQLGSALGWLSIGLGLAGLLAPRQVARLIGADEDDDATCLTLRLVGSRELLSGMGLLSQARPAAWAWSRVAGDALDLALLGSALQSPRARSDRLLLAGASVLGIACVDAYAARRMQSEASDVGAEGIAVHEAITIARPPEEVYGLFRDLENLPRFFSHLESVRVDNGHSRWSVRGPLGSSIEWDAEIVEDHPAQSIVWRSMPNADIPNQGRVRFRRAGDYTELEVELRYDPPAGKIGDAFAKLFGVAPGQQISSDLRRLKQVLETGEVLHSDSSIHPGMHPARPSELSAEISEEVRS